MTQRLPNFIIGGAPRSGTTFLAHMLDKHPDVTIARPFIPEPKVLMTPSPDGVAGYVARYQALFADVPECQVLGEKTSYYLENAEALERMCATLSDVRLVFIVREPVARAYSNYLWSRDNGLEPLSFVEAIAAEGKRPSPLSPDKAYARPFDYLTRGDYGVFAERYYQAYGRERVTFFLYEDIAAAPERLCKEIQNFIGVRPMPWSALETSIINSNKPDKPLPEEVAMDLRRRMAPRVEHFATVTGLDLSCWNYEVKTR